MFATACATTSSPSVDDIVASNLAARGGKERIQALNSIRASGTATDPAGRVAHIVREVKRPGMFRLEFNFQGTTSVFAHDGNIGWQVAPLQNQFEPMGITSEKDAASGDDQRDMRPAGRLKQKGHVVTLMGREPSTAGHLQLKVEMKGGGVRTTMWTSRRTRSSLDVTRMIQRHPTVLATSTGSRSASADSRSRTRSKPTSKIGRRC
jgi:hypothetical protein